MSTIARTAEVPETCSVHDGVPVYWIVNLVDRQVEVHWEPSAKGYGQIEVFAEGASVPVVIDGNEVGRITVNDILPNRKPTPEAQS